MTHVLLPKSASSADSDAFSRLHRNEFSRLSDLILPGRGPFWRVIFCDIKDALPSTFPSNFLMRSAQAFAIEIAAMSVVNETVEGGISIALGTRCAKPST
jgi:hypothetical protein